MDGTGGLAGLFRNSHISGTIYRTDLAKVAKQQQQPGQHANVSHLVVHVPATHKFRGEQLKDSPCRSRLFGWLLQIMCLS